MAKCQVCDERATTRVWSTTPFSSDPTLKHLRVCAACKTSIERNRREMQAHDAQQLRRPQER